MEVASQCHRRPSPHHHPVTPSPPLSPPCQPSLSFGVPTLSIVTTPTVTHTARFPPGTVLSWDPGHPARNWGWWPGASSGAGLLGALGAVWEGRQACACVQSEPRGRPGRAPCRQWDSGAAFLEGAALPRLPGAWYRAESSPSLDRAEPWESVAGQPFRSPPLPSPLLPFLFPSFGEMLEPGDPALGLGRAHMPLLDRLGPAFPPAHQSRAQSGGGEPWPCWDSSRGGGTLPTETCLLPVGNPPSATSPRPAVTTLDRVEPRGQEPPGGAAFPDPGPGLFSARWRVPLGPGPSFTPGPIQALPPAAAATDSGPTGTWGQL